MNHVLNLYRQFHHIPKELPKLKVAMHLAIDATVFFSLGFLVSQVIVALVK